MTEATRDFLFLEVMSRFIHCSQAFYGRFNNTKQRKLRMLKKGLTAVHYLFTVLDNDVIAVSLRIKIDDSK